MSALTISCKSALVVASLIAGLAQGDQATEIDSITLLQASVQVEAQLQQSTHKELAGAELPGEYSLSNELGCENKEAAAPKMPASFIELKKMSAPPAMFKDLFGPVRFTPEAESGDPAGATVLRGLLELMIIGIIFDGIRRWRLQQQNQDGSKQKVATSAAQEAEAAEEAAWLAMVTAASTGSETNFEKAIISKPSMSRTDTWGCTPLHFAAAGGSAAITNCMLKKGVEVDPLDASEETPLHFAARAGHGPICEMLLDAGADINAVNAQDMTPLVVSGHANQESVCRLLANRGAGCGGLTDDQLPPLVVSQLVQKVFANICGPA